VRERALPRTLREGALRRGPAEAGAAAAGGCRHRGTARTGTGPARPGRGTAGDVAALLGGVGRGRGMGPGRSGEARSGPGPWRHGAAWCGSGAAGRLRGEDRERGRDAGRVGLVGLGVPRQDPRRGTLTRHRARRGTRKHRGPCRGHVAGSTPPPCMAGYCVFAPPCMVAGPNGLDLKIFEEAA